MSINNIKYNAKGADIIPSAQIEELFSQCRLRKCSHKNESGCAVIAALEEGSLSASQWKNYQSKNMENNFLHKSNASQKQNEAFRKTITMHYRAMKKI